MNSIKKGNAIKLVPAKINFAFLDGEKAKFDVVFNYRSRLQLAALIKEAGKAAQAAIDAQEKSPEQNSADQDASDEVGSYALKAAVLSIETNAQYLMRALDSWTLDQPLSIESLRELCDETPAASQAIIESYSGVCNQGRLGN